MGTSTRPKRRRFQFHLATAILAMIAAGGWIGLTIEWPSTSIKSGSILQERFANNRSGLDAILHSHIIEYDEKAYGVPWPFYFPPHPPLKGYIWQDERSREFRWGAFVLDLGVFFGILVMLFVVSEWLVRRRTQRTTSP